MATHEYWRIYLPDSSYSISTSGYHQVGAEWEWLESGDVSVKSDIISTLTSGDEGSYTVSLLHDGNTSNFHQWSGSTFPKYAGVRFGTARDETVRYTNLTGVPLNELVMAVEPNHRGGFTLENIMHDNTALTHDMSGHRLTVYLPQTLQPGSQITLAMRFRIASPAKVKEHPYGYDSLQINLTDWYPFSVPDANGWGLHDEYYLGEASRLRCRGLRSERPHNGGKHHLCRERPSRTQQ